MNEFTFSPILISAPASVLLQQESIQLAAHVHTSAGGRIAG